jgi:hypothetical protein
MPLEDPSTLPRTIKNALSTCLFNSFATRIAKAQERSALLQARRAAFNRKEKISRGHGMWINCVELLGLRQDSSTRIARSKLEVLRCEDEYRSSTGAGET